MDISPHLVRTAEFKTVRKGFDPTEVTAFLSEVAGELERAQNQATAMEARARAAVARLQELSGGTPAAEPAASAPAPAAVVPDERQDEQRPISVAVDEAETISRTLLLAQRTADTTVAEAQAHAAQIEQDASDEAARSLESSRSTSARLLDEAREMAQRAGDAERTTVRAEVDSLKARRDFLESDVDHLERHLSDERSRIRDAAAVLMEMTDVSNGGLAESNRPVLSASDTDVHNSRQGGEQNGGDVDDDDATSSDGVARVDAGGASADNDFDGAVEGMSSTGRASEGVDDRQAPDELIIQTELDEGGNPEAPAPRERLRFDD